MLVVKSDKRSKVFRDRVTNLKQFSENNSVPDGLHRAMKEHLELHFHSEQVGGCVWVCVCGVGGCWGGLA